MKSDNSIEKFALAVASGSILILGCFLIADSRVDGFLTSFETYAKSGTWGVIAAIPAITIAYIVGSLMLVIADLVSRFIAPEAHGKEWDVLLLLARADSAILSQEFADLQRTKRLLEGSVFPLFVLAIGVFFERSRLPHLSPLLFISSAVLIACAVTMPFFTSRLHLSLTKLGDTAKQVTAASSNAAEVA